MKIGYFATPSVSQLWVLGLIGWGFKLIILKSQLIEGNNIPAGIGTLSVLSSFIYAPLLLLFNELLGGEPISKKQKIAVFLYMILMMLMLISTNSRNQVITPMLVVFLCYFIRQLYKKKVAFSIKQIVTVCLIAFIVAGPLSDLAISMLVVRAQKHNVNFTDLLDNTLEIYSDKEKLYKLKQIADRRINGSLSEKVIDWDEFYVSSLFFNRVCNYRVTDATIYHAQRAGIPNQEMINDFINHLMIMFPQPIVDIIGGPADKSKYAYSPMDKLYSISTSSTLMPGYRVGGDIGLSMSIFGLFSFLIIIFIYYFEFILLDNLVYYRFGRVVFSFLTLISIYSTYFLRFSVGGGIISHITFLVFGFLFNLILLLLVYNIVRILFPKQKNSDWENCK